MNTNGVEIDILRHAEVMIGNAGLGQKSRLRREGISIARKVLNDLIGIRMDKMLAAFKKSDGKT